MKQPNSKVRGVPKANKRAQLAVESAKEQASAEELYQKIFAYSNDAIFVIDPLLDSIIDVNAQACSMLGYLRDDLLAMPISAVHPEEMAKLQAFAQSIFENGRGWTNELTCLTKAGERLPSEISASSITIDGQS